MADITLQIAIALFGACAVGVARRVTGVWVNPLSIVFGCFFIPMLFSLFRFSGLQATSWLYETYVAAWATIGAWLLVPAVLLSARGEVGTVRWGDKPALIHSREFRLLVRTFALVVLGAYLFGNLIQTGYVFPITHPETAYQVHTVFPPIIRFFARANPAAVVLLYLLFWSQRKRVDLVLMLLVLAVPLSRLSRIDMALSLVGLAVLFSVIPLFKLTARRAWVLGVLAVALILGGAELGNLRTNRFGLYEVDYATAIAWKPEVTGPASVIPIAYGYFPLSFENFDQFVRQFNGVHMMGLYSFDWLFSGVVKLNWLPGFGEMRYLNAKFDPISSAANVPTALFPFYADFGPVGMVLPMMLYAMFWIFCFYKARESPLFLVLFALYSGGFALSSFQALIAAPVLIQQLIEVSLIFWITGRLIDRRIGHGNVRS